ncbi:type IV secretory system conjugative DNA transfer family protein, partial [Sphingomonas aquatica]|uniref:type IV secretory system conjugative DNA transfer family protein n=1 Tax=Sphingomonas aquatica TaxID=1763824 RepID=UPI00301D7635
VQAAPPPSERSGCLAYVFEHSLTGPLLTPDEVRTLREDYQLLFLAGQRPIVAAKLKYYADREFAGRFDKA